MAEGRGLGPKAIPRGRGLQPHETFPMFFRPTFGLRPSKRSKSMTTKLDLQRLEELALPEGKWLAFVAPPAPGEVGMIVQEDRSWED